MRLLDGQLVLSPSDLTKFTRCAHVTTLDLGRLRGTLKPLAYPQRSLHTDFLGAKGTEHEEDYIERLARAGNRMIRIEGDRQTAEDLRNAASATVDAMHSGADYINQAVFFDDKWVGYADLLEKVGDGRYEVIDVKLARTPKAHVLLQLAAYSEHLTRIQGVRPEKMHIILGTKERVSFRVADFEAYYRYIKSRFEERIENGGDGTLPYIVDFCSLCEWNLHCWRHLEQLDHLVRVANIRRDHVHRLEAGGITRAAVSEANGRRGIPSAGPQLMPAHRGCSPMRDSIGCSISFSSMRRGRLRSRMRWRYRCRRRKCG